MKRQRESADGERTEASIKREEGKIKSLTLSQLMASVGENELAQFSVLYQELMTVDQPDAIWRKFAGLLGRFEVSLGDIMRSNQIRINRSLQLLQILMGAQDQIQLVKIYKKLKQHKDDLPTLVRSIAGGVIGGQHVAQQQGPPVLLPSNPSVEWTTYEPISNAPPKKYGAVFIAGGKAKDAAPGEDALGIAVEVGATEVQVAVNGQQIRDIPTDKMIDLSAGDVLHPYLTGHKNRYLITLAEAQFLLPIGSQIKPVGRVLKNDGDKRVIEVLDRDLRYIPVP